MKDIFRATEGGPRTIKTNEPGFFGLVMSWGQISQYCSYLSPFCGLALCR